MTATILVVDHIEANVKSLEKRLASAYYTALTANSHNKAFEILKHNKIDIVLLDFVTIKKDLFNICKQIRSNPDSTYIPIIIIMPESGIDDRIKVLEAGADDLLTKPLNDVELFTRIDSLARMKSVIDELTLRNQTHTILGSNIVHVQEDFQKSKIIIINNDLDQSKYIQAILHDCTGEVKLCANPQDMDNILKNFIPDLFIISCDMANIDPLRICAALRAKEALQHSFIILMADKKHNNILIQGMAIGMNDYCLTDCSKSEIIARVTTQLRHKLYIDHLIHNLENNANDAIKDGLTNIFNRRYFDNHVQLMAQHAIKAEKHLILAMIDIDHFKTINNTFGHQTGDIVLGDVASIFKKNLRVTDLVARYGGDEFVIVITSTSMTQSKKMLDTIRTRVKVHKFYSHKTKHAIQVTLSVGMAKYTGGSVKTIITASDKALYQAKSIGRNKVICHKE